VLRDSKNVDNILLVDQDSIFIPPYNAIVMVRGAVNSPAAAVAYVKGADIDYYIRSAGGGTIKADEGRAYVLQPNGKVQTTHRRGGYLSKPRPEAGSIVQVPDKDPATKRDYGAAAQAFLNTVTALATLVILIKQVK
jgi:protein involved in polysaccharide export with SLBB domain